MGKVHTEEKVLRILRKNPDVRVNVSDKIIVIKKDSSRIGNKTLGKLDFLVNYCGYMVSKANVILHKEREQNFDVSEEIANRDSAKRKNTGFNLAKESKKAMKAIKTKK